MKIVCLGGGPAGLYFSILAKKAHPSWDVTVVERNRPDDTFGWGVVFSDKTMDGFKDVDPKTHAEITRAFRHWDDIDVFFKGRKFTSGGHGFCGIARMKLLRVLQDRAAGLGVKLIFPVFFLIFPSVILVTLGPAVILIFTQMKNLLAQ